jgi:ankyrin repeat protein
MGILCGMFFSSCPLGELFGNTNVDPEDEAFYKAVRFGTAAEMEALLKAGHDPNYMNSRYAIPWSETNPLWCLRYDNDKIQLLIDYGANVTDRPYLARILGGIILSTHLAAEMLTHHYTAGINAHEADVLKTVQMLLDAGANPNMKGDPSEPGSGPYDRVDPIKWYEEHGQTPVNIAIERNLFDMVDLLLNRGAVLDGKSLEFAQRATEWSGGNTEMENKIRALLGL